MPKRAQPKTTVIDAAWGDFVPSPPPVAPPPPPLEDEVTAARSRSALLDMPVDDLDDDTNVLTGHDLGRIAAPGSDPKSSAAAPAPVVAPAPVAAVVHAPAPVVAPAPATTRPVTPSPAPVSATPRVASVVAVRVAVTGRDGDLRLIPLAPGANPPPGAAVALLVPATDSDAAAINKLFGI